VHYEHVAAPGHAEYVKNMITVPPQMDAHLWRRHRGTMPQKARGTDDRPNRSRAVHRRRAQQGDMVDDEADTSSLVEIEVPLSCSTSTDLQGRRRSTVHPRGGSFRAARR